MKVLGLLSVLFFTPLLLLAYNPILVEPPERDGVILIDEDPYIEKNYLGDLEGAPDLYELTTDVSLTLRLQLKQKSTSQPIPFSMLIVRQNDLDGGVLEVTRRNLGSSDWQKYGDIWLGMSLLESPILEQEIAPGTYKIEVSTPDNIGAYMMVVGDEPVNSGLWTRLKAVFVTQSHFSVPIFFAIRSPYVLVLTIFIAWLLYWLRREWKSA
jgi:hypothetical protein